MSRVIDPKTAANTVPMPLRYMTSRIKHRITLPQPMKTAEEYRFVTKTSQRSVKYIRASKAQVWTTSVTRVSQKAERPSVSLQPKKPRQAKTNTQTYSKVH